MRLQILPVTSCVSVVKMAFLDDLHCEVHALLQSATKESLLELCAAFNMEGDNKTTPALLQQVRSI